MKKQGPSAWAMKRAAAAFKKWMLAEDYGVTLLAELLDAVRAQTIKACNHDKERQP